MAKIKLKPKARKGVISIKALIKHPMETGFRKKKGKLVPANHIDHMVILHNGNKIICYNFFHYSLLNKKQNYLDFAVLEPVLPLLSLYLSSIPNGNWFS
jgi:hypothetical protein